MDADTTIGTTKLMGWDDDVLGRRRLAEFLTRSLSEETRILATSNAGLTVALDGDWGSGKSFFVTRWASDLREAGYPVVLFDAWENDIGDEAAIALMASIKVELDVWADRLPKSVAIRRKARQSTKNAISGLRRAIAPASKAMAAGLLKKATGIAVDEMIEAIKKGEASDPGSSVATSSILESGLDEIFKQSLDNHQMRGLAIKKFKLSISDLIDLLKSQAGASVPVFVFVDEVDRCRPPYAIKLLEEIKHIFGMRNICYVVSTNLDQLQESVSAVYGSGFDGHRYLKRFFDRHYALPAPDNVSFSCQLLTAPSALSARAVVHGLPQDSKSANTSGAIAVIGTAFGLDLRSQQQVFFVACSAAAALQESKKVHVLWLFFLCALLHKKPHLFAKLVGVQRDRAHFNDICNQALAIDVQIAFAARTDSYDRSPTVRHVGLSEVIWSYYTWAREDLKDLREKDSNTNLFNYPQSNLRAIAEEMPNPYNHGMKYYPSIGSYGELVKYAGLAYAE